MASYHRAKHVRAWCLRQGIEIIYTPPKPHKLNGLIERINQIMIGGIRRILAEQNSKEWVNALPEALRAIRTSPHKWFYKSPQEIWNDGSRCGTK